MSPAEAAAIIRDHIKSDPDMRRATEQMVRRAGVKDIYEWCEQDHEMTVALAVQILDIDGQVSNMQSRLDRGDLS